ncbi:MAG: phage tail sheath family protein [Vulcanibacillus sp.]
MPGGIWTTQNKVRPGAYINFKSLGQALSPISDRGIVAIPLVLSWGAKKEVIDLDSNSNFMELLGYSFSNSELLLIKEIFKRAKKVLLYRVNGGTKASIISGTLTVTAKYEGIRGNAITVVIEEDIDNAGTFIVSTYLEGTKVYEQIGTTIESLQNNAYVEYSGTGALVASAGLVLAGGTDSTATSQDYIDYFSAIEIYDWNTMALPIDDETIKASCVAFINRLRNDEGKKVQAILANYPSADHEGIISVKNGVKLTDGTVIDKVKATAWVAGVTAGAEINKSNTYTAYEDSVDVDIRYTNTQIIEALNSGEFVFVENNGRAVVEQDINTFLSYTAEKGKEFRKNRVIRTLDSIGNDIKSIFSNYYIGKVDNTPDGRNLFKAEIIKYMESLQGINAIQNFNSSTDVTIAEGIEIDAIVVNIGAQPVDSIEKLYMTVTLV